MKLVRVCVSGPGPTSESYIVDDPEAFIACNGNITNIDLENGTYHIKCKEIIYDNRASGQESLPRSGPPQRKARRATRHRRSQPMLATAPRPCRIPI